MRKSLKETNLSILYCVKEERKAARETARARERERERESEREREISITSGSFLAVDSRHFVGENNNNIDDDEVDKKSVLRCLTCTENSCIFPSIVH